MMRHRPGLPLAALISCLVFTFLLTFAHGIPDYSGLPPGPYCAAKYSAGACCANRQDECSAPILNTTCYCDEFCDRRMEEDCCPDYWSHCKGIEPPELVTQKDCSFKGKTYHHGQHFQDNCNKCKCKSEGERAEVVCDRNRCLVDSKLLDEVNQMSESLGWRAENHSEFWGRTLEEGITLRLGTLNPSKVRLWNTRKTIYDSEALPTEFDARRQPHAHISGIRDQGWCGASWALSTVDVASDRYGLMSMGHEDVQLSAQYLISCNNRGQMGCKGGHLDTAWLYVRKFGLVDEDCYPWEGRNGKCRLPKRITLQKAGCYVPKDPPRREFYKMGPAYRLGNETDIMQEIMTSGPVQATMKVYQDFFMYKEGIYRHSHLATRYHTGHHSVRIIGWGEERLRNDYGPPTKYWTVANSWGEDWGEKGFFRILRGTNECDIESYVLAAWAKTVKPKSHNDFQVFRG